MTPNSRRRIQDKLRKLFRWHTDNDERTGITLYKIDKFNTQFQLDMIRIKCPIHGSNKYDYRINLYLCKNADADKREVSTFTMTYTEFDLLCQEVHEYYNELENGQSKRKLISTKS